MGGRQRDTAELREGNEAAGGNGVLTLTPDVAADVRAGDAYLLVTTSDFPTGALRGQLLPQPVRLPRTP